MNHLHAILPSWASRETGNAIIFAGTFLVWYPLLRDIGLWSALSVIGGVLATAFIIAAVEFTPEVWALLLARFGRPVEGEGVVDRAAGRGEGL